ISVIYTTSSRPSALVSFFLTSRRHPRPPLFPYTTLFRSPAVATARRLRCAGSSSGERRGGVHRCGLQDGGYEMLACGRQSAAPRSEEHTSELQSLTNLVCRLLLEKNKPTAHNNNQQSVTH